MAQSNFFDYLLGMVTLNQLFLKKTRKQRKKKIFKLALNNCPKKKGFCLKIVIRSPKKPNLAKRKTVRVFIPLTKVRLSAGIIGIGHNLQK